MHISRHKICYVQRAKPNASTGKLNPVHGNTNIRNSRNRDMTRRKEMNSMHTGRSSASV